MKKISFLLVVLLTTGLWANDLESLFENAYKRDLNLQTLIFQSENESLSWRQSQLKPGFGLTLGDGGEDGSLVAVNKTGNLVTVSGNPHIGVTLPYPLQTKIDISSPLSVEVAKDGDRKIPLIFSVNQPLNGIRALRNDSEIPLLEHNQAARDNQYAFYARKNAIREIVLTILRDIATSEKALLEKQYEFLSAADDLDQQLSLGSIKTGSSKYFSKDMEIRKLSRELEKIRGNYTGNIKKLELLTGVSQASDQSVIEDIDMITLRESLLPRGAFSPSVEQASGTRLLAEIKLREAERPKVGEIALNGGYTLNNPGTATQENLLTGGVSGKFDSFSLSTSVVGSIEKRDLTLSLGFMWSLTDKRAERLENEKLKNEMEIALINEVQAEKNLEDAIELLTLELASLTDQEQSLRDDSAVAERNTEDNRMWFLAGLIPEKELKNAEFEERKLIYDNRILQIDKHLFITKTESHLMDRKMRSEL